MVPSFCNAHVSVPYYAMLQMPKKFHMGIISKFINVFCRTKFKINYSTWLQQELTPLTHGGHLLFIFLIQYILNMKQKKREYYCVHGQAGRIKQSLVHVEFTVECFNIWTHIGLLRNTFKPKIAYSFMGDNWHWESETESDANN